VNPTDIQTTVADGIIAAAPAVGALFSVLFTPLAGAAVTGLLEAGARLWKLGVDPEQALIDLSNEKAKQNALDAAVVADREAREAVKFGNDGTAPKAPDTLPSPPPVLDDIYAELDALPDTRPE
jgi:hypothetical protein